MAFQLSPGVLVTEKDLTSIVPAVGTSNGAFAGAFVWGPVMDPTLISSENQLVSRFGKPTDGNAKSFFTAANFLAYTNNLQVIRVATADARNAVVTQSGTVTGVTIAEGDGGTGYTAPVVTFGAPNIEGGVQATGTAVVSGGVITFINIVEPGSGYTSAPSVTVTDEDGVDFVGTATFAVGGATINNEDVYMNTYVNGGGVFGEFAAKYPGALGNSIAVAMCDRLTYAGWDYAAEFDSAPGTSTYAAAANPTRAPEDTQVDDELHIVVIDSQGQWTGIRGAIIEKFAYVSKASDARKTDGANNYYRDVVNANSKYIWWMDHPASGENWGSAAINTNFDALSNAEDLVAIGGVALSGGTDDLAPTDGQLQDGFAVFANAELYDVSLIPCGGVSAAVSKFVVEQVAEIRKDCVAFVSPVDVTSGEVISGFDAAEKLVAFRTDQSFNVSSSYAVLDSGYKYQYDRYNDTYRWIPLNGDIAGLCARTDYTNDAWWSPGGLSRGQIKNVVKLAYNPNKAERDELYKNGVNPVVSFPGQGIVLFGDKTLLSKPSAFDRINVRRLFIVLEKAIATAAKYQLFEFNDGFTRAQFRTLVEPFLRDVQGRRGIIDFRVKCDETNNTGEVIDRNEFVADIFIKPTRVINFINLNFIAARTGVSFDEIGG
jgi:hypothetical protein